MGMEPQIIYKNKPTKIKEVPNQSTKNKNQLKCGDYINLDALDKKLGGIDKYGITQRGYFPLSESITLTCPNCKRPKNVTGKQLLDNLAYHKFSCEFCSDGISVPNKMLREVLNIFQPEKLKFEYTEDWCKNYRYDAYFVANGQAYVCEVDGKQHIEQGFNGKGRFISLEKQKATDKEKDKLAKDNNVTMIRIPCYDSYLKTIKINFESSELSKLFDLSLVNWEEFYANSQKSLVVEVWDYYNKTKEGTKTIADKFGIGTATALRYLKRGAQCGYCDYNGQDILLENLKKASQANNKCIQLTAQDTKESRVFQSITETAKMLQQEAFPQYKISTLADRIKETARGKNKLPRYSVKYL